LTDVRPEKVDGDKLFGLFLNVILFRVKLDANVLNADSLLEIFKNKQSAREYKALPYGYLKTFFKHDLFDFAFTFMHFHVMNENSERMEYKR
jgi:hypothetical protein